MDTISFCIINRDRDYAIALAEAFSRTQKGFCVDIPSASEWPGIDLISDRWDVYLVDSACLKLEALPENRDRILVLYNAFEEERPCDIKAIHKFSGCNAIAARIRFIFAESTGRPEPRATGGDKISIFSFFGVEGGAGVSSVALGLAREFSRYRGKRTLLISMEPFLSTGLCPEPEATDFNPADFLYYFLQNRMDKIGRLKDACLFTDEYGVARLPSCPGFNPFRELSKKEFAGFLDLLLKEGDWENLFIDWGNGYDRLSVEWIARSTQSVLVSKSGGVKNAINQDLRNMIAASLRLEANQLIHVVNMVPEDKEVSFGDIRAGNDCIHIPFDRGDFKPKGGGVDISLTNAFGTGIKEIADMILGVTKKEANTYEHYEFKTRNVGWDKFATELPTA